MERNKRKVYVGEGRWGRIWKVTTGFGWLLRWKRVEQQFDVIKRTIKICVRFATEPLTPCLYYSLCFKHELVAGAFRKSAYLLSCQARQDDKALGSAAKYKAIGCSSLASLAKNGKGKTVQVSSTKHTGCWRHSGLYFKTKHNCQNSVDSFQNKITSCLEDWRLVLN